MLTNTQKRSHVEGTIELLNSLVDVDRAKATAIGKLLGANMLGRYIKIAAGTIDATIGDVSHSVRLRKIITGTRPVPTDSGVVFIDESGAAFKLGGI